MSADFQIFDAATVEMTFGINLVEASAGTGKTYAIAMLVLRAVVELAVPIDKILIVTFTKAATEELRSRIRTRLVEARNLLAGGSAGDETLVAWAAAIMDREAAVMLLRLALADIDRAAIFTIHGFCQRMLVEQALESGQLFEVELLTDIDHVRREVADDFWRSHVYGLAPVPCSLITVTHNFSSPEKLLASVTLAFKDCPVEPPAGSLDAVLARLEGSMAGLAAWWQANSREFIERCRTSIDQGHFKKAIGDECAVWFQALDDFFTGRTHVMPEAVRHLHRSHLTSELNGQKVRGEEKKLAYFTDWTLPDALVDELLAAADELLLTLRVQLADKLRAEVAHRLEIRGTMGFDDLILRLSKALASERGEALKSVLGARFAVALIDEFQDTDAAQWSIFATIFGSGTHFLYLIGDPKQAIYKFRGADIHSYFQAKEAAGKLLTLEKNYRSHPLLVAEVNRLFSSRERPFHFDETTLGYRPVIAAKGEKDADLVCDGASLAGMVYCTLPPAEGGGRWSSTGAAAKFRSHVVAEICRLLNAAKPVILQAAEQRPLAPHDIAVLVRSNRQAEEYRLALAEASIPAVLSSRESVFCTAECRDLILVLQAIASPGETVKLKTALTVPWFGFTGNQLYELWLDEEGFAALHRRFLDYHRLWQDEGFLPMMSRLLVAENVLVTLAADRMAERAIANIHHLLELVQEEEMAGNLGIGEVLQWLGRMIAGDRGQENGELLLESDEEAVRIVTMHGAKGLEFPVVFCPFLWYRSNRLRNEAYQISCHDEHHRPVVDLGSARFAERREQALAEEMAEDLRLLYVALTRAKIRCYTMWVDVKPHSSVVDSFQSALGYLLFPDGMLPYEEQETRLQGLVRDHGVQLAQVEPDVAPSGALTEKVHRELRPLRPSGRSLFTDWQMSSFSSLAMQSEYGGETTPTVPRLGGSGRPIPFPDLPAGPGFGNVIHDLLQTLSFAAIARQEIEGDVVRQKCSRFGVSLEPAQAAGLLKMVVETLLSAEDSGDTFSLAQLDEKKCLKEMAFYYRLGRTATEKINEILAAEPTVVPVSHRVMQGYLTGFVDLICEHQGKFYILDYKTNYLGPTLGDYRPDSLTAAMQSHNYGLQYWIYTLVLHRHLESVMPDYSYHDHFGGVFYLFLRGMVPEIPGSGVFATLPDYHTLVALDRATGGREDD